MHATRFARWSRFTHATAIAALAVCWLSVAGTAEAQFDFEKLGQDTAGSLLAPDAPVTVQAMFVPGEGKTPARLLVTAFIKPTWHINSLTQGGDYIPTKIGVADGPGYKVIGDFKSVPAPDVHVDNGEKTEQHEGMVTWWAPIELAKDVDPKSLTIEGTFSYQACSTGCLPETTTNFSAKVGDAAEAAKLIPAGVQVYRAADSPITLSGQVEPRVVTPGSKLRLMITAEMDPGWHIYPLADLHTNEFSKPTLIVLSQTSGFQQDAIKAEEAAKTEAIEEGKKDTYYEQRVTWTVELTVPKDAKRGAHTLSGAIGYQTCKATACKPAVVATFTAEVSVGGATEAGVTNLDFSDSSKSYTNLEKEAALANPVRSRSLFLMLGAALLGGLILNAMPCVLPVIGLKILGFVEQSHDHRSRVFMLNMWFSLGLISVFLVLASLAVFLGLGWGEQFTQPWFVIAMAGLVFVMALSFLGVWEIPIPGFVGSGGAQQLASREGASGAFAKGVFTTVLATPCSGPFLGPVFGLLLRESPVVVYAVFTCVGIGMASPYLLIGAFPQLIRILPRPGSWMDTFKQLMAFVLLGTVVYLFTSVSQDYFIATFAMLIGLWLGCWWIGRTPLTGELGTKLISWGSGAAMAAAVGWFAFSYLTPVKELLDWQPYSQQTLAKLTAEGKTVFVDFTANWCPTCKANERFVINTAPIKELVDELEIVTLKADWTRPSDDIKKSLKQLDRLSIPVYAIYPADRPNEPIVLSDVITQRQLLDTLREAGKSRATAAAPTSVEKTAMKP